MQFNKVYQAFNSDIRLVDFQIDKFENFEIALVELILNANYLKVQAVANALSVPGCISRPSITLLMTTGKLDMKKCIIILLRMLENLFNFFPNSASNSLEELAWQIVVDYKDFSLEDFVLFFDLCRRKEFATEYQHISTRGVTSEFLIDWLMAYRKYRLKYYRDFKFKLEEEKKELVHITQEERNKYAQLKRAETDRVEYLSIEEKELEYYLNKFVNYTLKYFYLNKEERKNIAVELIKKDRLEFKQEYLKALERQHQHIINGDGGLVSTLDIFFWITKIDGGFEKLKYSAFNIEEYVDLRMKDKCEYYRPALKIEELHDFIDSLMNKIVDINDFKLGEELLCEIAPELGNRGCFPYTAQAAVSSLKSYLIKKYISKYPSYRKHQIDENIFPVSVIEYVKINCFNFLANKYFFLKNNKNSKR